jgi:hypothetical protein
VLAEHGDNIDAAIKHLTSLRLSAASTSAATPEQQAAAAEQQQQQQQQQQGAAAEGPAGPAAAPQKSADEWVDIVVQEMSAAKDMADARARASKVLQAFEQAAVAHSAQAQVCAGGSSGAPMATVIVAALCMGDAFLHMAYAAHICFPSAEASVAHLRCPSPSPPLFLSSAACRARAPTRSACGPSCRMCCGRTSY